MPAADVQLVSTGARTSLGLRAPPSAAAYRARISALAAHPFMVDHLGDPVVGGFDALLGPDVLGPARFLSLAGSALAEACAPLQGKSRFRLPVYLGLPEPRPGFTAQDAETVRSGLARTGSLPVEIGEVKAFATGHAAGLAALAAGVEQIRQGAIEACLVGGVDSYFQPETLEWLEETRQLAGADTRSAFAPGEGAGFCLLMAEPARKRFGLKGPARLRSVSLGRETKLIKTADVCLGEGLAATVRAAVHDPLNPGARINEIYCDVNGERYRGEEWGFVCLRLSEYFDSPTDYQSPADCWGDVGAASVPLFAMLVHQAVNRGYARGPRILLWAGSEGGLRGAAVLELTGTT